MILELHDVAVRLAQAEPFANNTFPEPAALLVQLRRGRVEGEPDGSVPKCPICGMPLSLHKKGEHVDLPEGMPKQIFKDLQKVRVVGRELRISRVSEKPPKPPRDTAGRHERDPEPGGRLPGGRPAERKMLSRRKAKK